MIHMSILLIMQILSKRMVRQGESESKHGADDQERSNETDGFAEDHGSVGQGQE